MQCTELIPIFGSDCFNVTVDVTNGYADIFCTGIDACQYIVPAAAPTSPVSKEFILGRRRLRGLSELRPRHRRDPLPRKASAEQRVDLAGTDDRARPARRLSLYELRHPLFFLYPPSRRRVVHRDGRRRGQRPGVPGLQRPARFRSRQRRGASGHGRGAAAGATRIFRGAADGLVSLSCAPRTIRVVGGVHETKPPIHVAAAESTRPKRVQAGPPTVRLPRRPRPIRVRPRFGHVRRQGHASTFDNLRGLRRLGHHGEERPAHDDVRERV